VDLGTDVLEIGPGFGVTTELLLKPGRRLTCVEIDDSLAAALERRFAGEAVHVLRGDATRLSFPDASFDSVACFTMLHHVPGAGSQDRLLAEAFRVLRPGGRLVGMDSIGSALFRMVHVGDTMCLVDPATFAQRLCAVGFDDVRVEALRSSFRFGGRRPG